MKNNFLLVKLTGSIVNNIAITVYNDKIENAITVYSNSKGVASIPLNNQTKFSVFSKDIIPEMDILINN